MPLNNAKKPERQLTVSNWSRRPPAPGEAHVRWIAILAKQARRIVLTAILGGLLAATMIRLSPGFGAGEEDLSADLSDQSRAALRLQRLRDANIVRFYAHYLGGIVRGDFGFSQALNRPVAELLKERLPETLNSV